MQENLFQKACVREWRGNMNQRAFLKIIQFYRLKLNMAGLLKKVVFALSIGAGVGILFQAIALVIPFYYVGICTIIILILSLLSAFVLAFIKRNNMEQTALVMDSFGFAERIVTAYGNLEKEGKLIELQRADAMKQLQIYRDKIRIVMWPSWKCLASCIGLLTVMTFLALMPSAMKERAQELHKIREEARNKTEEIEEILETLENLSQEQDLTLEQQAALQEMTENLQASQDEFQQVSTVEMMKAASQKLEYKYENAEEGLKALAQSLQNGANVSSITTESIQALSEKLQEMREMKLAQENSGQSGSPSKDGENSSSGNQNGQNKQSGNNDENGQSGNQNGQNGQSGNNDENGQSGNQNGQNVQSGEDGANGSDGQGDKGDGSGRGTGSSNTPHDYVSIPNDIADSENLTGNAVDHDASDYFHAQNGLSWEGTHMSYEAVIGSYKQNAYEGIAAGKYPSGMEEIIKEYFSNFNE